VYVEICELGDPPVPGRQFHPEFKSKPLEPHPLFKSFIGASCRNANAAKAPRRGPGVACASRPGLTLAGLRRARCAPLFLIAGRA